METERKFLVKEIPDLTNTAYKEISQIYISYDPEIRIRKSDNNYFITKKSDGTLVREEYEEEISKNTFDILSSLNKGRIVNKTRYLVYINGNVGELDIYHDELYGLVTLEVEFSDLEESNNFVVPSWVSEEVTYDKRYKNRKLSSSELSTIKELIDEVPSNVKKLSF